MSLVRLSCELCIPPPPPGAGVVVVELSGEDMYIVVVELYSVVVVELFGQELYSVCDEMQAL